jgi:predicted flavoprotein YhiN
VVPLLHLAQIDTDTYGRTLTQVERTRLLLLLKAVPITVTKLLGKEKAVVTAGGVHLKEVDFSTMESRLVPKLYIVGDMLDIDRPSGGYSLQLCWTTGYVAGGAV